MNGSTIGRAKPHVEHIDFSNKAQSIHRSDSRSSVATISFGRSGSAHNTAQSANAMAKRFPGHGSGRTTSSTNFLDELLNLRCSVLAGRSLGEGGTSDIGPPWNVGEAFYVLTSVNSGLPLSANCLVQIES
jgi:hypothetical protein